MDHGYQRIPIIKLWTLLLVPLQGELTDKLAGQLTSEVLSRIHEQGCSGLVIDITGLWLVDSHLCAVLSELSAAASLMGARTLLSGMKPDIALTLETMGVELKGVRTTLNLEDALIALGVRQPEDEYDEYDAFRAQTISQDAAQEPRAADTLEHTLVNQFLRNAGRQ
jgi:rsbT antagonist protein RsbS